MISKSSICDIFVMVVILGVSGAQKGRNEKTTRKKMRECMVCF